MVENMVANMTNKDWELIEKAKNLHYSEYQKINALIDKADSDNAKEWMQSIRNINYHKEEFTCDLI